MADKREPTAVYWLGDTLYLNITNKCSNHCIFCLRNFKRGIGDFTLKLHDEPTFEQITTEIESAMRRRTWKEVVFCGFGEPTERLNLLLEVTKWIRHHFSRATAIRINTNGQAYILNPNRDVVKELKDAGITKVSVSLNAGNEQEYNEVCRPSFPGSFFTVLEFIRGSKNKLDTEVSAVTTTEVDLHKVENLARDLGVKFRIRQCIPCFW